MTRYQSFLAFTVSLAIILSIILLIVAWLTSPSDASAQTGADYTVEYTPSNLYAGRVPADEIHYDFSGLDDEVSYCWTLLRLSNDGSQIVETINSRCQPAGNTTANIEFIMSEFFGVQDDSFGPLIVQDHFGNIIGRHFIAPVPNDDWESETPAGQTAIAGAVYEPENSEGWQHPIESSNPITMIENDYTLLHFRYDDTHESNVFQIELWPGVPDETTTLEAAIDIEDITDYQTFGMSTSEAEALIGEQFRQSFIILNTSGDTLSFIDNIFSNAVFPSDPIEKFWRNPHTNTLLSGMYDYAMLDDVDGSALEVGESVLAVSDRGQIWFVEHRDSVTAGLPITVEIDASDSAIWNAYESQELADELEGVIDSTDHDFNETTTYEYDVNDTPTEDVEITYTRQAASDLFSDAVDKRFELVSTYDIVENPDALQLIKTVMEDSPMNDNVVSLLAFGVIFGVGIVLCSLSGRCPPVVYAVVFVGLVIGFIVFGLFTAFLSLIMGMMCVIVVFAMIQMQRVRA